MANDLTPRSSSAVTLPPALPRPSPRLSAALRDVLDPHPAIAGQHVTVPPHTMLEAEAVKAIYERWCSPATPEQWRKWLVPINAAVRNPQSVEGFDAWCALVASACRDIPASVLTAERQRDAVRTFQFFPAAADVDALLRPHAAPLLATRRALAALTAAEPPVSAKPEDQAERERILAEHRARMAEIQAVRPAEPSGPGSFPPAPLHPDHLASIRDANPLVQRAREAAARKAGISR